MNTIKQIYKYTPLSFLITITASMLCILILKTLGFIQFSNVSTLSYTLIAAFVPMFMWTWLRVALYKPLTLKINPIT